VQQQEIFHGPSFLKTVSSKTTVLVLEIIVLLIRYGAMSFSDNTEPIWRNNDMVFSMGDKKLYSLMEIFRYLNNRDVQSRSEENKIFVSLMILCQMNPFYFDFKDAIRPCTK